MSLISEGASAPSWLDSLRWETILLFLAVTWVVYIIVYLAWSLAVRYQRRQRRLEAERDERICYPPWNRHRPDEPSPAAAIPAPATQHATVRYYRQMLPHKVYPLLVILSRDKIRPLPDQPVEQTSSQPFAVPARAHVEVEPVLPGCRCYPPRQEVKVGAAPVQARFQVVGDVEGEVTDARVVLRRGRTVLAEVPLRMRVGQRTLAWVLGALALVYPYALKYLRADVETQIQENFTLYWQALRWLVSLPWWVVPVVLLAAGLTWWVWRRPREGVFWNVQVEPPAP